MQRACLEGESHEDFRENGAAERGLRGVGERRSSDVNATHPGAEADDMQDPGGDYGYSCAGEGDPARALQLPDEQQEEERHPVLDEVAVQPLRRLQLRIATVAETDAKAPP